MRQPGPFIESYVLCEIAERAAPHDLENVLEGAERILIGEIEPEIALSTNGDEFRFTQNREMAPKVTAN